MDNANKTRRLLFRLGTVLILIGFCVFIKCFIAFLAKNSVFFNS